MHIVESKGILSANGGMNVFRGCTHGCIYCDSRSKCYQMNHDFEDIEVKGNAPALLEMALLKKRKRCMIGTGAMTDPYIPLENQLKVTRKCIEVIDKYSFGLAIQTKSDGILRDLELLKSINSKAKCVVQMTFTTFDEALCAVIEPKVCTTKERFKVLQIMLENGIPTVVWLDPILPFINDTEENLRGILDYCFKAEVRGIICFNMGLTLRDGNREYFYKNLDKYFPGLAIKYQKKYGNSYEIISDNNTALMDIFYRECKAHNVMCTPNDVFKYLYQFPEVTDVGQLRMF